MRIYNLIKDRPERAEYKTWVDAIFTPPFALGVMFEARKLIEKIDQLVDEDVSKLVSELNYQLDCIENKVLRDFPS